MLLKLLPLLLLASLTLGETSTRELCPSFCKCTYSTFSQGLARCSTLDPEVQKVFPQDIRRLVVENDPNPKNITDFMFLKLGLKKISTIKIVNSSVLNLDIDAFNGLTYLTDVDLSDNRLMLIHPDTFRNNTELKRLVLSGNPLQLTQLLPTIGFYVLRSDSLSELYLSRCQMKKLSNQAFSELNNLDRLDLSYNNIREIDPKVFIGLDQLEDLDLSFNELSNISYSAFINMEDFTSLNLRGNPLPTFNLPNLPELSELDLSQCRFITIGPETFEGVSDVNKLNLSHNLIYEIDIDAFASMTSLRYLDLSFNDLQGPLNSFLIEPLANLETLSFASNRELKVMEGFDGEFSSLYLYDLSDCGLSSLNGKMFRGMHYLATFNASGNDIERIEPTTFSGLTHINVLDLSGNRLQSLHPNLFASNHMMTKLYLSDNLIYHLSVSVFRPLAQLYTLDLSCNMISTLFNHTEADIMQEKKILSKITHLNVAGNNIKHIHTYNFLSMAELQVLDITDNPLECNQNFFHVIRWLSDNRILPNADKFSHPISLILDDRKENYVRWMTVLDSVCPVDLKSFEKVTAPPKSSKLREEILQRQVDPEKSIEMSDEEVEEPFYQDKSMIVDEDSRYEVVKMADEATEWSTLLLVSLFSVFFLVVFLNIGLILFFRARRNYSLVGYKSTFSGGPMPQSRFPLRKGQRNAYQKLYEECSVPNKPIVKNGKKLNIISIFGSQTEMPPQHV